MPGPEGSGLPHEYAGHSGSYYIVSAKIVKSMSHRRVSGEAAFDKVQALAEYILPVAGLAGMTVLDQGH